MTTRVVQTIGFFLRCCMTRPLDWPRCCWFSSPSVFLGFSFCIIRALFVFESGHAVGQTLLQIHRYTSTSIASLAVTANRLWDISVHQDQQTAAPSKRKARIRLFEIRHFLRRQRDVAHDALLEPRDGADTHDGARNLLANPGQCDLCHLDSLFLRELLDAADDDTVGL
jgi:hypothetical protein